MTSQPNSHDGDMRLDLRGGCGVLVVDSGLRALVAEWTIDPGRRLVKHIEWRDEFWCLDMFDRCALSLCWSVLALLLAAITI